MMKNKKIYIPEISDFSLLAALKSSAKFVLLFKKTFLIWSVINFIFLYVFKFIPNGWTNSLSIIWLVSYYIFLTIFIRYTLQHKPYFSLIRIFNSLVPSSKIMFMNIIIYLLVVICPYIPLLMGLSDKYLELFELYMDVIQSNNSLSGKALFYSFMLLISPYTIIRPYLAWISSLVGKSRSIMDAYKKTKGYYWRFVSYAIIMSSSLALSYYIDTIYNLNTSIYIMTFLFMYFNIVFISLYKCFYKKKTKKSS